MAVLPRPVADRFADRGGRGVGGLGAAQPGAEGDRLVSAGPRPQPAGGPLLPVRAWAPRRRAGSGGGQAGGRVAGWRGDRGRGRRHRHRDYLSPARHPDPRRRRAGRGRPPAPWVRAADRRNRGAGDRGRDHRRVPGQGLSRAIALDGTDADRGRPGDRDDGGDAPRRRLLSCFTRPPPMSPDAPTCGARPANAVSRLCDAPAPATSRQWCSSNASWPGRATRSGPCRSRDRAMALLSPSPMPRRAPRACRSATTRKPVRCRQALVSCWATTGPIPRTAGLGARANGWIFAVIVRRYWPLGRSARCIGPHGRRSGHAASAATISRPCSTRSRRSPPKKRRACARTSPMSTARVRAGQLARDGQGSAVRALLALSGDPAPPVPGRVRRRPASRRDSFRRRGGRPGGQALRDDLPRLRR